MWCVVVKGNKNFNESDIALRHGEAENERIESQVTEQDSLSG